MRYLSCSLRPGWALFAIAASLLPIVLAGCHNKPIITGGGSSFIDPMMRKWAAEYPAQKKVDVDYTSSGSGDGIKQMIAGKNLFGCTDAPMSEEQMKEAGGAEAVIHVPLVMGAVVPIYNLPNVKGLKFTGPLLADVYLGKVKKWNAKAIKDLNPTAPLPEMEIVVVRRADGSGTSHIFTDYLSKVSPEWKEKVGGASTNPKWPPSQGEAKNPGVAKTVSGTPGAIGYVELTYALKNEGLNVGLVMNSAGEYTPASLESVTAAADASLKTISPDLRFSIVNADGKGAYPISGTVWAVCKVQQGDKKGPLLANFLRWCIHDGQRYAPDLHYARLPPGLVGLADKKIDLIK